MLRLLIIISVCLLWTFNIRLVNAALSVSIAPINPVIESNQKSVELSLTNQSKQVSNVQIRVLAWKQVDNEDRYLPQKEVMISPPFLQLLPEKRHLIRIINRVPVPEGQQKAYRIIIDEVPIAAKNAGMQDDNLNASLNLKNRYIIPLFTYGDGIWTHQDYRAPRDMNEATKPTLFWRLFNQNGKQHLQITNNGPVHAKLSQLSINIDNKKEKVNSGGLWGYILAGASIKQPLEKNILLNGKVELQAKINEIPELMIIPAGITK